MSLLRGGYSCEAERDVGEREGARGGVRLLWLLRHELHLSVKEIRALRWADLSSSRIAHPHLAQAIAEYRDTLAPKSFLLHPEAPVFASRKRGVGGRQTPISRQQMDDLLRPGRAARHGD